MQDINKRLSVIEERLLDLELKVGIDRGGAPVPKVSGASLVFEKPVEATPVPKTMSAAAKPQSQPLAKASATSPPLRATRPIPPEPVTASRWMAWCAGITFVLAALYFLKLVYDTGWLTPGRQVSLAYLGALSLVACGFVLSKEDRQYAAYLPAVGLVVLYLTTFTAHLYYQLMPAGMATALVGVTTVFGIWLGRHFGQSVYVIFSALCVYASPWLVRANGSGLLDLVVYYSAWSLLFSFCAVQEGRRLTYLLPMYLAILGFDNVFRLQGGEEWLLAAVYQLVQFLIFGVTTVLFSVLNERPLQREDALPHGIALFVFYGIEYALLHQHVPGMVNYLAMVSGIIVWLLYVMASRWYAGGESLKVGAVLVSSYCSWVAVHAVFFGELDHAWLPWAVLCTPIVYRVLAPLLEDNASALMPITLACLGLFVVGYAMLLGEVLLNARLGTQLPTLALFIYTLLLYGMYWHLSRGIRLAPSSALLMLYAGHLAWIACMVKWVEGGGYLSACWGVYGVALLVIALAIKDKVLGKSALVVFSAAAFKVLLFDLSGSNSMTRVLMLLVISASLYTGGWLYQSLVREQGDDRAIA